MAKDGSILLSTVEAALPEESAAVEFPGGCFWMGRAEAEACVPKTFAADDGTPALAPAATLDPSVACGKAPNAAPAAAVAGAAPVFAGV